MLIDNIFFPKLESSKNRKKKKKWGSLTLRLIKYFSEEFAKKLGSIPRVDQRDRF